MSSLSDSSEPENVIPDVVWGQVEVFGEKHPVMKISASHEDYALAFQQRSKILQNIEYSRIILTTQTGDEVDQLGIDYSAPVTSAESPLKISFKPSKKELTAQTRGENLVQALRQDMVDVPESDDVAGALVNVADLSDAASDVLAYLVVTQTTVNLWEHVLRVTESGSRACVRGSPGTGKSVTSFYLIKKLLFEMNRPVVYLLRTVTMSNFFYQFIPLEDGSVEVSVFPESAGLDSIDVLARKEAYYICDPGSTKDTCNPSHLFEAHVVINASGDSRHWGESEFVKRGGEFVEFPLPDLDVLISTKEYYGGGPDLTNEMLLERSREFGSIPRHLFASEDRLKVLRKNQQYAMNALSTEQLFKIVDNTAGVDANDPMQPKSAIVAIDSTDFVDQVVQIVSDSVEEKVVSAFIKDLWDGFNGEDTTGRKMYFERYVRSLFSKSEVIVKANFLSKSTYKRAFSMTLGGCTDIKRVDDLYTSVKEGDDNVIYYSRSSMEELIDFMYKRDGTYYAIQVTDSSKHDTAKDGFGSMKDRLGLGDSEKVFVVYTVPEGKFPEFRSNPVQPVDVGEDHQLQVFLAEIRNPADKPYESNVTLAHILKISPA